MFLLSLEVWALKLIILYCERLNCHEYVYTSWLLHSSTSLRPSLPLNRPHCQWKCLSGWCSVEVCPNPPPQTLWPDDNANKWVSEQNNPDKPIAGGFFRLEKGTPLVYEYAYDEMKIILEGEFAISDESGQAVKARPGDVFYFPQGSRITFTTESGGLAFFVGFLFFFFPCSWVDIANIADRTTGSCMRGQFLPVGWGSGSSASGMNINLTKAIFFFFLTVCSVNKQYIIKHNAANNVINWWLTNLWSVSINKISGQSFKI